LAQKIKVGAVSYLNTKPLVYGFEQGMMSDQVGMTIDYPSKIAIDLLHGKIDIGLVPVAIIPSMTEHHIISDYCIGSDGEVATVCLFSDVPIDEIENILLDYQSRTSVALLKILLKEHWKISPNLINASAGYEKKISGTTAGLVIGDRAFQQRLVSKHIYDLGAAWKAMTGLPFVFAAWISNKKMTPQFEEGFNAANQLGFDHMDEVLLKNPCTVFDLADYYHTFIKFRINSTMREALALFLKKIKNGSADQ
jgi:chorismate dehydratase